MSNAPSDAELTACYREANGEMHGKAQPLTTQRIFRAMRAAIVKWGTPQPVVREPLTTLTIAPVRRFLADRGIYLSDETTKELIVVAHGITQKGGRDAQAR